MAEPELPPPPDSTPFDADGALLGFALPWESAAVSEPPSAAGLLPDWLTPAPPPAEPATEFNLFDTLGLSAVSRVAEPSAAPSASFPMPWETVPAPQPVPTRLAPSPEPIVAAVMPIIPVPSLSEEALKGHDLLTDLLTVPRDDAAVQTRSGWADEADEVSSVYAGPEDQYMVVQLGGTDYGVGLPGIVEIGKRPVTAPLPHVPAWLLGLTNLRGDIVSVVDLRTYFGFPAVRQPGERLIVIRNEQGLTAGLLVDGIRGLRRIPASADRLPIDGLDTPLTPYVTRMIDHDDRLLPLLDLPRLLTADDFTHAAVPA